MSDGDKILIVDDDARLRSLLERFLLEQGYRVRGVENVEQMERMLARELFSLVVLDLMLLGEDGLSACRRLRAASNQIPIIMLTTQGDEAGRIAGLEQGAETIWPNHLIPASYWPVSVPCYAVKPNVFPVLPVVRLRTCTLATTVCR